MNHFLCFCKTIFPDTSEGFLCQGSTLSPSLFPSEYPTNSPSINPSILPSLQPTINPTMYPSSIPTVLPSNSPNISPTSNPSIVPTYIPSYNPTINPTINPSNSNDVILEMPPNEFQTTKVQISNTKKDNNPSTISQVLLVMVVALSVLLTALFCLAIVSI